MAQDNTKIVLSLEDMSDETRKETYITGEDAKESKVFKYDTATGDKVVCKVSVNSINYNKAMYQPDHVTVELKLEDSNNLSMLRKCAIGLKANLSYPKESEKDTTTYIAQNLFVYNATPTVIYQKTPDNVDPVQNKEKLNYTKLVLHIYSWDKLMDIDKYSQAFTCKRLGQNIINDNITKFDRHNYGLQYTWSPKIMGYSTDKEIIQPYVVQYNETFRSFINRVANRSGEFLYWHNGALQYGLATEEIKDSFDKYVRIENISEEVSGSQVESDVFNTPLDIKEGLKYDLEVGNDAFLASLDGDGKKFNDSLNISEGDAWQSTYWDGDGKYDGWRVFCDLLMSYVSSGGLKEFATGFLTKTIIDNPFSEYGKLQSRKVATAARNTYPINGEKKDAYGFIEAEQTFSKDGSTFYTHFSTAPNVMPSDNGPLSSNSPMAKAFYATVKELGTIAEKNAIDVKLKVNAPTIHIGQIVTCDSDLYIVTRIDGTFDYLSDNTDNLRVRLHAIPVTIYKDKAAYIPAPLEQPVRVMDGNSTATITDVDSPFSDGSVRVRFSWQAPIKVSLNADELKTCRQNAMEHAYKGLEITVDGTKTTLSNQEQYEKQYLADEPLAISYPLAQDVVDCINRLEALQADEDKYQSCKKAIEDYDDRISEFATFIKKEKEQIESEIMPNIDSLSESLNKSNNELIQRRNIHENFLNSTIIPNDQQVECLTSDEKAIYKRIVALNKTLANLQEELKKTEDSEYIEQLNQAIQETEDAITEEKKTIAPKITPIYEGLKQTISDNNTLLKYYQKLKTAKSNKDTAEKDIVNVQKSHEEYRAVEIKLDGAEYRCHSLIKDVPSLDDKGKEDEKKKEEYKNGWNSKVTEFKAAYDRRNKFQTKYDTEVTDMLKAKEDAERLKDSTPWIRMTTPMAGKVNKCYMLPTADTEVLVGFENGNPERPYIIGSLFNSTNADKKNGKDGYVGKAYQIMSETDTGIIINNEKGSMADLIGLVSPVVKNIATSASLFAKGEKMGKDDFTKNKAEIGGKIQMKDKYGFFDMTMSSKERKVSIKSALGDISLSAFTGITISAPNGDIKINGKNVMITAGDKLVLKSGTNKDILDSSVKDFAGFVTSLATKMAVAVATSFIGKKAIDLSLIRAAWEVAFRPLNGTLQIHSNRHLLLEAGKGAAELPFDTMQYKDNPACLVDVFPNFPYYLLRSIIKEFGDQATTSNSRVAELFTLIKNVNPREDDNDLDVEDGAGADVAIPEGTVLTRLSMAKFKHIINSCVISDNDIYKVTDDDNVLKKYCPYPGGFARPIQPDVNTWLNKVKTVAKTIADFKNAIKKPHTFSNKQLSDKYMKTLKQVLERVGPLRSFDDSLLRDLTNQIGNLAQAKLYFRKTAQGVTTDTEVTNTIDIFDADGNIQYDSVLVKVDGNENATLTPNSIQYTMIKMLVNAKVVVLAAPSEDIKSNIKKYKTIKGVPDLQNGVPEGYGSWQNFYNHCFPAGTIEEDSWTSAAKDGIVDTVTSAAANYIDYDTIHWMGWTERNLWNAGAHKGMILMSEESGAKTGRFGNDGILRLEQNNSVSALLESLGKQAANDLGKATDEDAKGHDAKLTSPNLKNINWVKRNKKPTSISSRCNIQ